MPVARLQPSLVTHLDFHKLLSCFSPSQPQRLNIHVSTWFQVWSLTQCYFLLGLGRGPLALPFLTSIFEYHELDFDNLYKFPDILKIFVIVFIFPLVNPMFGLISHTYFLNLHLFFFNLNTQLRFESIVHGPLHPVRQTCQCL